VRIRSLLAMEAHLSENVHVSTRDVDRVQKLIKKGTPRSEVFPDLGGVFSDVAGEGVTLTVRFSKKDGARSWMFDGAMLMLLPPGVDAGKGHAGDGPCAPCARHRRGSV
jgi:hypothetical protein